MIPTFILATGPSMSQEVANRVAGLGRVIAISDAYTLAPCADALCSSDAAWWRAHPAALEHPGRKFGAMPEHIRPDGVERVAIDRGSNSGLLALQVAVRVFHAKKVILLGFDMKGSHFFGAHDETKFKFGAQIMNLKNTTADRFEVFKRQLGAFQPRGVQIINATPGSALKAYPLMPLEEALPC